MNPSTPVGRFQSRHFVRSLIRYSGRRRPRFGPWLGSLRPSAIGITMPSSSS